MLQTKNPQSNKHYHPRTCGFWYKQNTKQTHPQPHNPTNITIQEGLVDSDTSRTLNRHTLNPTIQPASLTIQEGLEVFVAACRQGVPQKDQLQCQQTTVFLCRGLLLELLCLEGRRKNKKHECIKKLNPACTCESPRGVISSEKL